MVLNRARMYGELGYYAKAGASFDALESPSSSHRLRQAAYCLKGGNVRKASGIYRELSASEDSAVRMIALAGLMDCSVAYPHQGLDSPDRYAARVAAVSSRVMTMDAPAEKRILALRTAAKSLLKREKYRRDASFLLFRALALAEQSGQNRLAQLLQFESNAVIVQKPEVYRGVIDYFSQQGMPFAQASALFMLGANREVSDRERIDALRSGLSICQYYGIPATARDAVIMEKHAVNQLADLLIANARFFELFEASEQAKLLELQRNMQSNIFDFRLPAGNEKLQNEIIELSREITGLLQRKISIVEEGGGFAWSTPADAAINRKRGRLYDLFAQAGTVSKSAADQLQLTPATLRTVQKSLKPGQALVKLFIRDSLSTALLISNREMEIVSSPALAVQVQGELVRLRRALSSSGASSAGSLIGNADRLWLTHVLLRSMTDRIARYEHLVFIADVPVPFHLLGYDRFLGREKKLSLLGSASEAVRYSELVVNRTRPPDVVLFDASRMEQARIHKMMHPEDAVFLCWKTLRKEEVDELKTLMELSFRKDFSGSGFLNNLASVSDSPAAGQWLYLSSYGMD